MTTEKFLRELEKLDLFFRLDWENKRIVNIHIFSNNHVLASISNTKESELYINNINLKKYISIEEKTYLLKLIRVFSDTPIKERGLTNDEMNYGMPAWAFKLMKQHRKEKEK